MAKQEEPGEPTWENANKHFRHLHGSRIHWSGDSLKSGLFGQLRFPVGALEPLFAGSWREIILFGGFSFVGNRSLVQAGNVLLDPLESLNPIYPGQG